MRLERQALAGLSQIARPMTCAATADVVLVEAALDEHAAHVRVLRRLEPGTVIAEIVEVGAVEHVGEAPLALLLLGDLVELALAVKAPVRGVGHVARALDLVRLDELVPGPDLPGDRDGRLFLEGGEAGRHGRHPDGAGAEDLVRHGEDERAVDAARVANEGRAHVLDAGPEAFAAVRGRPCPGYLAWACAMALLSC